MKPGTGNGDGEIKPTLDIATDDIDDKGNLDTHTTDRNKGKGSTRIVS